MWFRGLFKCPNQKGPWFNHKEHFVSQSKTNSAGVLRFVLCICISQILLIQLKMRESGIFMVSFCPPFSATQDGRTPESQVARAIHSGVSYLSCLRATELEQELLRSKGTNRVVSCVPSVLPFPLCWLWQITHKIRDSRHFSWIYDFSSQSSLKLLLSPIQNKPNESSLICTFWRNA